MIVAVVLVGYALAGAFAVPRALSRATWPQRAPRLGIAMWLAVSASVVLALGLAGLALAVPAAPVSADLGRWLQACAMALRSSYATPGGIILSATGAAFAVFVAARVMAALSTSWIRASRDRNAHRRAVLLAGRRDGSLGAVVVACDSAAAYCVPGRDAQVIVTTGAVGALSDDQLAAVLAHEQAHLRGRHHHLVGAATAMAAAFPGIPLFRLAKTEVAMLVEMIADDVASGTQSRVTVAAAVVALASMRAPAAALGASGSAALERVQRLASPTDPLPRTGAVAAGVAVMAILAFPAAVAAGPALHAAQMHLCPLLRPR